MEGIKGYSRPAPDGKAVIVDTEAMMVDLITLAKVDGQTLEMMIGYLQTLWPQVEVNISIPKDQKQ